jgi:hypothetical protein
LKGLYPFKLPAIGAFIRNRELRGTLAPLKTNLPLPLSKGEGDTGDRVTNYQKERGIISFCRGFAPP